MSFDVTTLEFWVRAYERHLDEGGTQSAEDFLEPAPDGGTAFVAALRMVAELREHGAHRPPRAFGQYRIQRELGRGAQGIVYLAEDEKLGRQVALKVLKPGSVHLSDFYLRFRREAEAASRVEHPNLCTVHAADIQDGLPYIAMRYVEGTALSEVLRDDTEGHSLSLTERLALVEQVARGVDTAHRAGLTHRDIKPANILITESGRPVLVDFGLAHIDEPGTDLTRTGEVRGTPAYMAPEQIRGEAGMDARVDVHALGVVAYELISGRRPYDGATWHALYRQIQEEELTKPRRVGTDLWVVLQTALAKDPNHRYASAADLAEDLRRVRMHEPIRARPASWLTRVRRFVRRRPAVAVSLALLLVGPLAFAAQQGRAARRLKIETRNAILAREQADRRAYLANIQAADASLASFDAAEARRRLEDCAEGMRGWEWRYLSTAADESVRTTPAHAGAVSDVALSADGTLLASAGKDRTVRLWSADDLRLLGTLEGIERGGAVSVAISHDGQFIAAGCQDNSIMLWRRGGELVARLTHHPRDVMSVSFSPDGKTLLSGCQGNLLVVYDLESERLRHLVDGGYGTVRAILVAPDSRTALYGTNSGRIIRLDLGSGSTQELTKLPGQVWSMVQDEESGRLLVGLSDGTARLIDAATGTERQAFRGHARRVSGVAFMPQGLLATTSLDGALRIWQRDTGALVRTLVGHIGSALCVRWSGHAGELVTGGADGSIRSWLNVAAPARVRSTAGESYASDMSVHPDSRTVAVGGWRGWVFVHDAWTGQLVRVLPGHGTKIHAITHSPDGAYLLSAGADGTVRVWDAHTFEIRHVLMGAGTMYAVAVSPDGTEVAAGGTEGCVRTWDLRTGCPRAIIGRTRRDVRDLAYGPGGTRIAAARSDGITVYDLPTGEQACVLPGDHHAVAYCPDRQEVAAIRDTVVHIHAIPTGTVVQELIGHDERINSLVYHPDGTRLATGSVDQTVRLWDVQVGTIVSVLRQNTSWIQVVAWSPDGTTLASAASDRSLQIWRAHRPPAFHETLRAQANAEQEAAALVKALEARDLTFVATAAAISAKRDVSAAVRARALHLVQRKERRKADMAVFRSLWPLLEKREPGVETRALISKYMGVVREVRPRPLGNLLLKSIAALRLGRAEDALALADRYHHRRSHSALPLSDPLAHFIRALALVAVGEIAQAQAAHAAGVTLAAPGGMSRSAKRAAGYGREAADAIHSASK